MPHLSELHGATTHLAVVAGVLYAVLLVLRRTGRDAPAIAAAEPWVLGGAVLGVLSAGATGLLVRGESQTELRGSQLRVGTVHFWLGIALALLVVAAAVAAWLRRTQTGPQPAWAAALAVAVLAAVSVQGYLGGRMTYEHGVGVHDAGAYAQSARGAADLELALARGVPDAQAGMAAFSRSGLGCASCHGDRAQGERGPRLAGGVDLEEFRGVHQHGLFPPQIVTDRDFAAIETYLKTLSPRRR